MTTGDLLRRKTCDPLVWLADGGWAVFVGDFHWRAATTGSRTIGGNYSYDGAIVSAGLI